MNDKLLQPFLIYLYLKGYIINPQKDRIPKNNEIIKIFIHSNKLTLEELRSAAKTKLGKLNIKELPQKVKGLNILQVLSCAVDFHEIIVKIALFNRSK